MKKRFTKFFSVDSPKAIKADKFGYLNAINYMAPHTTGGAGNLCPHSSAGCRSLCLGMYSGQAAIVSDLENGTNPVRESRKAKSQWFMNDRKAFMNEMTDHVRGMIRQADRKNKKLAVRPNGSTDIAFEYIKTDNGKSLPMRFPEIQFIDYTKNLQRVLNPNRPSNYHLTFSLSETNRTEAKLALASGVNVAVVFGDGMPKTFMGHKVIDGLEHDLRHLDPSPVIVGLEPKGSKAKNDTSGFVVRRAGC
jgi:hypothetical protein|tara:strand:+ start:79 stop:825 length:747 start_codon:yes stop_codon:yes gene_type:complete